MLYSYLMTNRKDKNWTKNLEDAFHNTKSGRAGELAVIQHLKVSGCTNIIDWESDRDMQVRGIDISYDDVWGCSNTIQVKENYIIDKPVVPGAPAPRYFYIEVDSDSRKNILCVEADFMIHVNMSEMSYVLYQTSNMQAEVLDHNHTVHRDHVGQECTSNGVPLIRVLDDKFNNFFAKGFLRLFE